ARMSREELRAGYVRVLNELYEPGAFFERVEGLYLRERFTYGRGRARYWRRHPWNRLRTQAGNLFRAAGLYLRLMRHIPEAGLRREYRKRIARLLRVRRAPDVLLVYLVKCAMHYHHHTMARQMAGGGGPVYNSF